MLTLVVSDIFGKTDALEELAGCLSGNTKIVDPYDGAPQSFDNEAIAYRAFSEQVGLPTYVEKLLHVIKDAGKPAQLLGFSIGASACWCVAAEPKLKAPTQIVCFYDSQIRHHIELNPRCKTTLVFPKEETNFDVQALAQSLEPKHRVAIQKTLYLHGFMNPRSVNFDAEAYAIYVDCLQVILRDGDTIENVLK